MRALPRSPPSPAGVAFTVDSNRRGQRGHLSSTFVEDRIRAALFCRDLEVSLERKFEWAGSFGLVGSVITLVRLVALGGELYGTVVEVWAGGGRGVA
ncbi:MAG: hypothetical protein QG671_4275 [Actinomycetota bacterium]|nr:hypothetical protein [Actinomycetota bacterium]